MVESVISVRGVSKAYRIWDSPASRLTAPLRESAARVIPGAPGRWLRQGAARSYRDFWALKDISFEVARGESVGIIGRNGSGKSTLLQIIVGTLQPTSGSAWARGRVAALLELGSGFNPEFTGRENVYLNGAVLGLKRAEVDSRFAAIAEFADIGAFIDQPVKTYSSGMIMRLAFAVQTAVEPDVLIVDEALSVGDFFFSQKCMRRMQTLRQAGTTLLFVSHDMGSVRDITNRAVLLEGGSVKFAGETQRAISHYFNAAPAADSPGVTTSPPNSRPAAQDQIVEFLDRAFWRAATPYPEPDKPAILAVACLDEQGQPLPALKLGQTAKISVLLGTQTDAIFHAAIELKNRYDQVVCSLSTVARGIPEITLAAGECLLVEYLITFNFEAGLYTLNAVIGDRSSQPNRGVRLAQTPWIGPLKIEWDYEGAIAPFLGMFGPPAKVSLRQLASSTPHE